MKNLFRLLGTGALTVLAFGLLSSCSDSEEGTKNIVITDGMVKPAKSPDFNVFSGGRLKQVTFNRGATNRSADVNGNLWYQNWKRPTNVTEDERTKVIAAFSQKREGEKNTRQVTWENFWVQQVYKGEASYTDGYGQDIGVASGKMNHLLVFNTIKEEVISWWPYEVKYTEYEGKYEHINNFNSGNNTTTYTDDENGEKYIGTTLMTHIKSDGRDEQFAYHNSIDSKDHYEYIILEIDGAWYVGFDFYATHPEGQEGNKNMDVERDWVFNDWIVKICPAQLLGEEIIPTEFPDPTELEDETVTTMGHVEVNLSMNAEREKDDYIASKLSIHVRDTTDVELFIPVPAELYCAADDMYIVVSHREELLKHSPSSSTMEFDVNGHTVNMTVAFEMDGIRINTKGVNADVLKYLRKNYGDGITFEVWNYYNDTANRDMLKILLDKSTISFAKDPGQYINAFAIVNGAKNPLDCIVNPPSSYLNKTANDGNKDGNYNVTYTK
jgi:hypothetical protein